MPEIENKLKELGYDLPRPGGLGPATSSPRCEPETWCSFRAPDLGCLRAVCCTLAS